MIETVKLTLDLYFRSNSTGLNALAGSPRTLRSEGSWDFAVGLPLCSSRNARWFFVDYSLEHTFGQNVKSILAELRPDFHEHIDKVIVIKIE